MITQNEPLIAIQARIEELQSTITEKEQQIKARAITLKEDLQEKLSMENIVRQHPFQAAGITFVAGLLLTKTLRARNTPSLLVERTQHPAPSHHLSEQSKTAFSSIGFEVLRSMKDIGVTYLQRYLEKKIKQ